jgi:hypothetical protein
MSGDEEETGCTDEPELGVACWAPGAIMGPQALTKTEKIKEARIRFFTLFTIIYDR